MDSNINSTTPITTTHENIVLNFTQWQTGKWKELLSAEITCLQDSWKELTANEGTNGTYCNATWDGLTCWPPTPANQVAEMPCSKLFVQSSLFNADSIGGSVLRFCSKDSVWVDEGYTNYSICVQEMVAALTDQVAMSYDFSIDSSQPYLLFVGCLLSVICLTTVVLIYGCFKSMESIRIKILMHIMVALLGRSLLWMVIVGPSIFPNFFDYRSLNWTCNVVFSLHFYTLIVTAFWMVALAHYLNQRLTRQHYLLERFPRIYYVLFGWGLPILIVSTWATLMFTLTGTGCWSSFTTSRLFWIISFPLVAAFMANLMYLLNILRIFVKRISLVESLSQQKQIRSARRDIVILFPILGINHLLFLYNPGGDVEKYYMLFHAMFQSVQGIIVSILCCFLSSEVRKSVWKAIRSCLFRHGGCDASDCETDITSLRPLTMPGERKRVTFAE